MALTVSEQPPDDDDLVQRVKAGCTDALGTLYDRYAAMVYRVAYSLLRSTCEAEDVVQDVFLGLPLALRSYAGRGSLGGWIRRVAERTVLMRLRTERRRKEDPLSLETAVLRARGNSPEDRVALDRALAALSKTLRVVFILFVVEGYSHKEIEHLLGIKPGASKTRLSRARERLQDLLS